MNISFSGNYKSVSSFTWSDVAPLSIVTGLNGVGKSQLLQVINDQYNQEFNYKNNNQNHSSSFFDNHEFDFKKFNHGARSFDSISDSSQSFVSYSDLKLVVDTLYSIKHPQNQSGNQRFYFDSYKEQQLQSLVDEKLRNNHIYNMTKTKAEKIWKFLVESLKKNELDITPEEIALNFPDHILFENNIIMDNNSLSFTFFIHEYKRLALEKAGKNSDGVISPWQILNEAMEASGLPYRVTAPSTQDLEAVFRNPLNASIDNPFKVKICHVNNDYELEFNDLSSGEKILMSLAILLYYSKSRGVHQELMLLDEPDAHLHPSMTKQFFQVVYDVLVKKHGVKVIMTTHSPSTISLAPEGTDCVIYELKKNPTIINKASSRESVISFLTEGMILVMPSMRSVLIEGKDDKPFYEAMYRMLSNAKLLNENIAINFVAGTGVSSVNHWSKGLREAGLSGTIRGIIDRDNGNAVSEGITRLDRYSIENYMIDPIIVLATGRNIPQSILRYGIEVGEEEKIRLLTQEQLQNITDSVLDYIKSKLQNVNSDEEIMVPVRFTNGKVINYPKWFLERRGKDLFGIFNNEFGRNLTREALTTSFKRIQLIPEDILLLFKNIQY